MAESFTLPLSSPILQPESPARLMQELHHPDVGRQLAQLLANNPETANLLEGIASLVGEEFQADCCLVALHDGAQGIDRTSYWYASDSQRQFSPEESANLNADDWVEMLAGADLLAISDTKAAEEREERDPRWETLPMREVLGITTRFQGRVNGAIILMQGCDPLELERDKVSAGVVSCQDAQASESYCWTAREMMKLTAVSEQLGIALNHAIQTEEIGSLEQQIRYKTKHQSSIHELTIAIHRWADIDRILQMAINTLAETLEVDRGRILLLKYAEPLFKARFQGTATRLNSGRDTEAERSSGSPTVARIPKAKVTVVSEAYRAGIQNLSQSAVNQSFWLSECHWCQQAFASAPNFLAISDQRTLLALNPDLTIAPIFDPETLPAVLAFPLVGVSGGSSGGTIFGFIVLEHSTPRHWQAEELQLVELVAAQLSTAILHSQTMQQVQALVEERTAQLQRSLDVQAKLYEKTRQQIDQLRQLNQLKDEFITTLSHELNTPLTSMKVAIQMLRQPGLTPDRQARYLDILESEWSRESNLVKDLLKLQQYESDGATINVQTLDLRKTLNALAQSFERKWEDKGLDLLLELPKGSRSSSGKQLLKLNTDAESFDRILHELLTNAGKYSEPGTTVYLRADRKIDLQHNHVTIALTNTGSGISPEDLPHIFEKFRRGQGVTQQAIGGTGLGLALVKCLVQHLNGTINVTSYPIENSTAWETCFTLTLPQLVTSTPS